MAPAAKEQPFEQLPIEILSSILLHAVSIYDYERNDIELDQQLRSYELHRLICHRWNDAIEGEPAFWSSCSVHIVQGQSRRGPFSPRSTLHSLGRYFARSGLVALTLGIQLTFEDNLVDLDTTRALIQFIGSHSNRWSSLHLEHAGTSSGRWTADLYPWWLSLLSPQLLQDSSEAGCFQNVQRLTLDCESILVGDVPASKMPICKIFPNIAKLNLVVPEITEVDAFLAQIRPLKDLTWLRLSVSDFGEDPRPAAPFVHQILTQHPQLLHFEVDLETEDLDEETTDNEATSTLPVLVHRTLTSLSIPGPAQFGLVFRSIVFPALATLVVGNGERGEHGNGRDHLGCMQRMLQSTSQLHTLQLGMVNVANETLTAILCDLGSSLQSLHIIPHRAHRTGAFLLQLLQQSKTRPVLPRLVMFIIEVRRQSCRPTNSERTWTSEMFASFNVKAFEAFVEDPRRSGRKLPGLDSFEHLRHAALTMHGMELYSR
ncbi:hypothetical protein BKA70DRAFT_1316437 [Coprinopsis sp. MPI-PUGE-AT-0042]|nr:hypothetical protein BKA70DRAFT_1331275 [Coprinopsis sp. MPI-PUGE-AT-0042]KAH6896414.1 hypothetical protein BKA70DRAFT_1316437 [Coprinopsis sp. MPI-PUGE-AT-0042]